MNVIYRVHGAGGFYMETQSQDQAFRAARQEAAQSGQMALVSFTWAGRSAWFVRFETHTWCGKTEEIAVFRDVCDCYIECNVEQVERWVSER